MTIAFDEKAIRDFNEKEHRELLYDGQKVSTMRICQIPTKMAREYIATNHYTHTMPDSTKICFAGWYGDKLAGIVVFGMGVGVNQYKAIIPDIEKGEYLELTRLWSADSMPRNTESKLIAESIKQLPKQYRLIISFADPSRGHVGYIYQATNWIYLGMSSAGTMLVTELGIEKHPRLLGIYKIRHPELKNYSTKELLIYLGWTSKKASAKHRYVFLTNKRDRRNIVKNSMPYPKIISEN